MESGPREHDDRLSRIRQGDTKALAAAFDEYRPRLQRTAAFRLDGRLRGRVDVDDILQEAFLSATQRCGALKGDTESSLFIWVRLIVLQTMADVHRRHLGARKRDAGKEVAIHRPAVWTATSVSLAAELVGTLTSPSEAAGRVELAEQLHKAIDRMDPVDQEVLALRHFEELANHEVAEVLGIEQKAASIRYVRALRRLREILAGFPGLDPTQTPGGPVG